MFIDFAFSGFENNPPGGGCQRYKLFYSALSSEVHQKLSESAKKREWGRERKERSNQSVICAGIGP
jgi:hypothetical protein